MRGMFSYKILHRTNGKLKIRIKNIKLNVESLKKPTVNWYSIIEMNMYKLIQIT